jgi:hypothetical protein
MFERQSLIKNSFLKSRENLRQGYAGITNGCIADAVGKQYRQYFLKKMKATNASMAHTESASVISVFDIAVVHGHGLKIVNS